MASLALSIGLIRFLETLEKRPCRGDRCYRRSPYTSRHRDPANGPPIYGLPEPYRAKCDGVGSSCQSQGSDVDIVAAGGEAVAGIISPGQYCERSRIL